MAKAKSIEVSIAADAIQALAKVPPVRAVEELIWNSLDADATKVEVALTHSPLGDLSKIKVTDNGTGMSRVEAEEAFAKVGGSKKAVTGVSPGGRPYHGREGKGRYKAFALGSAVNWRSSFADNDGSLQTFELASGYETIKRVRYVEPTEPAATPGFTVTITNVRTEAAAVANSATPKHILQRFAPYLLAFPGTKLIYDDNDLDPKDLVKRDTTFPIISKDHASPEGKLRIIEWSKKSAPTLYLCDENQLAFDEREPPVKRTRLGYTAYLSSNHIRKLYDTGALTDLDEGLRHLVAVANDMIQSYFRERLAQESAEVVKRLHDEGVYPYKTPAKTPVEKAERQVFDICTAKIHQYLPEFNKGPKQSREFTYSLLREALERSPTTLTKILGQVVRLPPKEQADLAKLMERTSLSAIIRTARTVSDRLVFINGFEQIVYGKEIKKHVRERSQLHRILVEELWILGDEYLLGTDDVSLRSVLKEHLKILGREELAKSLPPDAVKDLDDIPDLCIWRQFPATDRTFEHLVIELKSPKVKIGPDEVMQAQRYAQAVSANPLFDKDKTHWTFVAVSGEIRPDALDLVNQRDRPRGLIVQSKHYDVWAKTWAEIIHEAKVRHQFLRDKLQCAVEDNEEGMNYLREKYSEYLSPEVMGSGETGPMGAGPTGGTPVGTGPPGGAPASAS